MKNKKLILGSVLGILITIMFFTYQVVITYDTSHYLWLTSLLTPSGNFQTWDVARGIVFPLLIRIFNILFGKSVLGVLTRNVYILCCNVNILLFNLQRYNQRRRVF